MTEIMPVPRNLILLSYQQRALGVFLFDYEKERDLNGEHNYSA